MTKTDLINYISENGGFTKADSARAVELMQNGITQGLKEKGKVTLTGFCTFSTKRKEQKEGRNPRTGETVIIPERTAVVIKPGSKLKDALN